MHKINLDKILSCLLIFSILLFILMFIKVPYNIYIIGGVLNLENKIDVKDYECSGEYDMVYVKEADANVLTYLFSLIHPEWNAEKMSKNNIDLTSTKDEINYRGLKMLENANSNAIYYAYKLADKPLEITSSKLMVIYVLENSKSNLKVKDEIISINGKSINDYSINEILKDVDVNDTISIEVINDNKKYTRKAKFNEDGKLGIMITPIYTYKDSINFKFDDNESGPSGGMIMTLALYDYLNDYDLAKGRIITGTGTIDNDGSIGEVSGIKYKLKAAVNNKADIFLVSKYNYKEAIKLKKKYNYNIKIIKVDKIEDAISYLKK